MRRAFAFFRVSCADFRLPLGSHVAPAPAVFHEALKHDIISPLQREPMTIHVGGGGAATTGFGRATLWNRARAFPPSLLREHRIL